MVRLNMKGGDLRSCKERQGLEARRERGGDGRSMGKCTGVLITTLPELPQNSFLYRCMLSVSAIDYNLDDDYWSRDDHDFWLHDDDYELFPKSYRATSVGSWEVTSMGRGFDWTQSDNSMQGNQAEDLPHIPAARAPKFQSNVQKSPNVASSPLLSCLPLSLPSPVNSSRSLPSHSPSSPRPRCRSSQQRVSLFAGRVSIAPVEISSTPPMLLPSLKPTNSSESLINVLASIRASSPVKERSFLSEKSISEYVIQSEIGRGAYGIVKRGREIYGDGSLGVSLLPLPLPLDSLKRSGGSRL